MQAAGRRFACTTTPTLLQVDTGHVLQRQRVSSRAWNRDWKGCGARRIMTMKQRHDRDLALDRDLVLIIVVVAVNEVWPSRAWDRDWKGFGARRKTVTSWHDRGPGQGVTVVAAVLANGVITVNTDRGLLRSADSRGILRARDLCHLSAADLISIAIEMIIEGGPIRGPGKLAPPFARTHSRGSNRGDSTLR